MKAQRFYLDTDLAVQRAINAVRGAAKGLVVTIGERPRRRPQENKFWAGCKELSDSVRTVGGKTWSQEAWADSLYAAWCHQKGHSAEFMPPIFEDMPPTRIGRHTSRLSEREYGELLDIQQVAMALHMPEPTSEHGRAA